MTIEEQVPLAPRTTFRIGGPARFFARARTREELAEALRFAAARQLPLLPLGGGSNVLVADGGFPGLVASIELRGVSFTDCGGKVVAVTAAAGESWDGLVAESVHRGLYGIENLSGIPGTVGAAPIQNIGAYGAEVADVIASVEAMDMRSGARVSFLPGDCAFGYRDSFFKTPAGGNFIITAVTFQLSAQGAPNIEYRDIREYIAAAGITAPSLAEIREAVLAIRSRKFPDLKAAGTAGSFFKNPVVTGEECVRLTRLFPGLPSFPLSGGKHKIALGWLLERLGWKGVRRGAAGVFERQALVLVNYGGATAAEVAALAAGITHDVKKKTNLTIAPEIVYVGGA